MAGGSGPVAASVNWDALTAGLTMNMELRCR
jgi:hypothetical protein